MGAWHPDERGTGGDSLSREASVERLAELLAEFMTPSSVIVCIGNSLMGDDGAGPAVARELADALPWPVFDAQTVPENYLMKIVALKPESVVLVDAVSLGAAPGAVELVAAEKITGQGPSTHGPAPLALFDVLRMMHPCRCAVLGIQPAAGAIGSEMSAPVRAAVERVVRGFRLLAGRR